MIFSGFPRAVCFLNASRGVMFLGSSAAALLGAGCMLELDDLQLAVRQVEVLLQ
jgi:hypothetical protein